MHWGKPNIRYARRHVLYNYISNCNPAQLHRVHGPVSLLCCSTALYSCPPSFPSFPNFARRTSELQLG